MASRAEFGKQWIEAQQSRDADKIKALGELINEDAVWTTPRGEISGKAAILERLQTPPQGPGGGGMMSQIKWGEPSESGDGLKIVGDLPPDLPIPLKGLELDFTFDASDKVSKIQTTPRR